jgi:formylmethanofuran dehydrogenase subunit E
MDCKFGTFMYALDKRLLKSMDTQQHLLNTAKLRHGHQCPHQVLGVRFGLAGLRLLDMDAGTCRKNLLVIVETDGCFVNGIEVTAQVSLAQRSLRIEDYGKIAATFVQLETGHAFRLFPKPRLRDLARKYTRNEHRAYLVQLIAYQILPDTELLDIEPVALTQNLNEVMGLPRQKILCSGCGEEINSGREAWGGETPTCIACAGYAYYRSLQESEQLEPV